MKNYFCGHYFRCVSETRALALIPAVHVTRGVRSASLQIITDKDNYYVSFPPEDAFVDRREPHARLGGCGFSEMGVSLDVIAEEVRASGELHFGKATPLKYGIMGPFEYIPFMECVHSVHSMRHSVSGTLKINGEDFSFYNGSGYTEGDRGASFPRRYAWTQSFFEGGSLMLSVADIPFFPVSFTGLIGFVYLNGEEIRLATYKGARVLENKCGRIVIKQGEYEFSAERLSTGGRMLSAPRRGAMTRLIKENVACPARYRLTKCGEELLDVNVNRAAFEYEY